MTIKFAVIALWAEDVPACAHFYRDVLGACPPASPWCEAALRSERDLSDHPERQANSGPEFRA